MHYDLIRWFFNENGLDREAAPPPAAIEHFQIKLMLENIPMQDLLERSLRDKLPNRDVAISAEMHDIDAATTAGQVIKFMRRGTDMMNQQLLVRKALEFEDEVVPEIIRMLKTSLNDLFIELSARVLALCSKDIADELIKNFDDMRGAYAKSMVLVALGFKAPEKRIPWLVKKFNELKREYPNESFCYGAYYAIFEMESRFYGDAKISPAEQIPTP
ncbi:MAG: hypothetical protein FWC75_00110 [Oscillospiraceae bacterium]|nr:hypothetical protein [Oscillospiraceae bacterium]